MGPATLFNGNKVVFDAMVIINFHGLIMLDKLIGWAPQEIVVEKRIKKEASHSMNGPIDLEPYISSGVVIEEDMECRPCGAHGHASCPIGTHACMRDITAERVIEIIDKHTAFGL